MAATAKRTPAAKRTTATKRPSKKGKGPELAENHTESEAVAHAILTAFGDLEPSVNRIMYADLSEPARMHAISLFRDSLTAPGDPYRNPAKAIEAAQLIDDAAAAAAAAAASPDQNVVAAAES